MTGCMERALGPRKRTQDRKEDLCRAACEVTVQAQDNSRRHNLRAYVSFAHLLTSMHTSGHLCLWVRSALAQEHIPNIFNGYFLNCGNTAYLS